MQAEFCFKSLFDMCRKQLIGLLIVSGESKGAGVPFWRSIGGSLEAFESSHLLYQNQTPVTFSHMC